MIFDFLTQLISPVTTLVDQIVNKDEHKLAIKTQLTQVQVAFAEKALEYENKITEMQSQVIIAEAKSESWVTRSWRPILMLTFGFLIVWSYAAKAIGIAAPDLPPDLWMVIKIGLGGYVIGRSAEKVAPSIVQALKAKDKE